MLLQNTQIVALVVHSTNKHHEIVGSFCFSFGDFQTQPTSPAVIYGTFLSSFLTVQAGQDRHVTSEKKIIV